MQQTDEIKSHTEFGDISSEDVDKSAKKPITMRIVYSLVLLGIAISSFTTPFIKIVLNMGVSGESVTFYRLAFVAICLAPVCFSNQRNRQELKLAVSNKHTMFLLIILGVCKLLGILLAAYALRYVPILFYNTIFNLNPVYVIILAYIILHERISSTALIGVGICIFGVLIVGGQAILSAIVSGRFVVTIFGISMALLAGIASAVYIVVSKLMRVGISLVTLMFVLFAIASLLDLSVCLITGASLFLPMKAWLLTIVLALLCTLVAQGLPVWAVKYMSPSLYSVLSLMAIVLAAIEAYLMLKEIPNIYTVIGAILLILGLTIFIRAKKPCDQ